MGEDHLNYAVSVNDILRARENIEDLVKYTPCHISSGLSELLGCNIYLKNEALQSTRSYKVRGVANALRNLSEEQRRLGVICASAGNHALALCTFAMQQNIPVTVCMPVSSSRAKYLACVKTGANVILEGNAFEDAKSYAESLVKGKGYTYINGYNDPDIISGQGTIGIEILEQVPDVDTIFVPIGGGGLLAGVATYIKAVKPSVRIIGVQTGLCNAMFVALEKKQPTLVNINFAETIAEGLGVGLVGENGFKIIRDKVDKVIEVEEDIVSYSILKLMEYEKIILEGAGASALAGAIRLYPDIGQKVVVLLSGANIDASSYSKILNRGLVCDAKIVRFDVVLPHSNSAVQKIMSILTRFKSKLRKLSVGEEVSSSRVNALKASFEVEIDDYQSWLTIKQEIVDSSLSFSEEMSRILEFKALNE